MQSPEHLKLTAVIEPAPEGGFTCWFEEFPEVFSEGETVPEAEANLFDALGLVSGYLEHCSERFRDSSRALRVVSMLVLAMMQLCCGMALGTPDHRVKVEEILLGSNERSFAILRTEEDNLSSYYRSRTRRHLDEYEKVQPEEKEQRPRQQPAKSTLLLDVTSTRDPNDLGPKPSIKETVHTRDETVALAKVLGEFPRQPWKWNGEMLKRLKTDQRGGVAQGRLDVVWGGFATEKLYGERNTDSDWVLEEAYEDGDTVFLRVATPSQEDERRSRILSVPVRKTQQMRDHLNMPPLYVSAGDFSTEKEARDKMTELAKVKTPSGNQAVSPDIWTMRLPTDKTVYVVVVCDLETADTGEKFRRLESLLGLSLSPQSSRDFIERLPLPEPPTPKPQAKAEKEKKAAGKAK